MWQYRDAEVKATESTFIALVQSLLKDPVERAYFFQVRLMLIITLCAWEHSFKKYSCSKLLLNDLLQEVFPVEYGHQYDAALHMLLWELLSKLEKLLPVPDLKQVFSPSRQTLQVIYFTFAKTWAF